MANLRLVGGVDLDGDEGGEEMDFEPNNFEELGVRWSENLDELLEKVIFASESPWIFNKMTAFDFDMIRAKFSELADELHYDSEFTSGMRSKQEFEADGTTLTRFQHVSNVLDKLGLAISTLTDGLEETNETDRHKILAANFTLNEILRSKQRFSMGVDGNI